MSSDCVPSNIPNNRFPSVPRLNLPITFDHPGRCSPLPTTPGSTSPRFFIPNYPLTNSAGLRHPHTFSFSRQSSPSRSKEFASFEQDEIDRGFLQTFNIEQKNDSIISNQENEISIISMK
jgi:hypothetical protein